MVNHDDAALRPTGRVIWVVEMLSSAPWGSLTQAHEPSDVPTINCSLHFMQFLEELKQRLAHPGTAGPKSFVSAGDLQRAAGAPSAGAGLSASLPFELRTLEVCARGCNACKTSRLTARRVMLPDVRAYV